MPCVSPDGKPTESGLGMLRVLREGKTSAEAVAAAAGMPLYRVRSGLRDLTEADYVSESDGSYSLTEQGTGAVP